MHLKSSAHPQWRKERRYRRYDLQYPVHVQFPVGNSSSELEAVSRNLSIGGMLIESEKAVPQDCPVALTIRMKGQPLRRALELKASGKVVRVTAYNLGFAIAVKCSQPISEMEAFLTGSDA